MNKRIHLVLQTYYDTYDNYHEIPVYASFEKASVVAECVKLNAKRTSDEIDSGIEYIPSSGKGIKLV